MPSALRETRNPFTGQPLVVIDSAVLIGERPLRRRPTDFASLGRNAVRLVPNRSPETRRRTRFGGIPTQLDGAWPSGPDGPLTFLGQLDFAELAKTNGGRLVDLPDDGLLHLFYDTERMPYLGLRYADRVSWTLRFVPDSTDARPVPLPGGIKPLPQVELELRAFRSFPFPNDSKIVEWADPPNVPAPDGGWHRRGSPCQPYLDSHEEHRELLGARPWHWVGGHAAWIQSDVRLRCELISRGIDYDFEAIRHKEQQGIDLTGVARQLDEWELLWQIDTADGLPDWGDGGTMYVMIRQADLRARRFDRAWLTMDCH